MFLECSGLTVVDELAGNSALTQQFHLHIGCRHVAHLAAAPMARLMPRRYLTAAAAAPANEAAHPIMMVRSNHF